MNIHLSKQLLAIFFGSGILLSCFNDDPEEAEVIFSFESRSPASGRTESDDIQSIHVTVQASDGSIEESTLNVQPFGNGYLAEPLLLGIGDYELTKFLVLNSSDEIIFATPLQGSSLASLVDEPLPVSFQIASDQVTNVGVQVIATDSLDPEDLGYASVSFDINPTMNILLSVLTADLSAGGHTFIESKVTVSGDADSLFTVHLGDSINVVKLRKDFSNLTFDIQSAGYRSVSVDFTTDSLQYHQTVPISVVLDAVGVRAGLLAYYPLDGDATEALGSGNDGTISGPVSATGFRNDANGSYNFDGIDDHINFGDVFDLGTSDFTVSIWTKVDEFEGINFHGDSYGAWMIAKGITIAGTPRRAGFGLRSEDREGVRSFQFSIGSASDEVYTVRESGDFQTDIWYHLVGVKAADRMYLYLNGELLGDLAVPAGINVDTNIPLSLGRIDKLGFDPLGTQYFGGSIDDVRLYNRALGVDEVGELAAERD